MKPSEIKDCLGKRCIITFINKQGDEIIRKLNVQDITYVPLYGDYLIGDVEDICLDRVTAISLAA